MMRGKLFARCALVTLLAIPIAASAEGAGSGSSTGSGSGSAAAAPTHAKRKAANNPGAKHETLSDADVRILGHVHNVNLAEIEMATLALDRSSNTAVKGYARTIVKDHTKGDKNVLALAKASNAILPTSPAEPDELAAQQQAMSDMDALRGLTGTDFDVRFLASMAEGHAHELTRNEQASKDAVDARLRTLLIGLRPVLQAHATQAAKIALTLKPAANTGSGAGSGMGSGNGSGSGSASRSGTMQP